ncbi:MAG: DPP IV N-terminal domain-containing protein [Chitinophagaceae bacterium]
MNNRLTNFMWMIMPFLVAGNLFPMITFSQSQKIAQSNNKSIVPQKNLETLRAIYEGNELNAKSFNANWLPDGSGFTVLENEPGLSQRVLASYDAASGKRTVLFNPNDLILSGLGKEIFSIQNYQFSNGGKCILIQLNGQNEKSKNSGYWMLDLKTGKIQKVIAGRNNIISPDGQKVLFTKDGNLQVYNLKSDSTVALTNDAVNGSVSNGQSVWSPDGKKIAFVQTDESGVKLRSALIPGDPSYPGVSETRFARVGGNIAKLRVGVIDASGKKTRWVALPMPSDGFYLGELSWAGNSETLLVEQFNRFRTERNFFLADVNKGTVRSIYKENDPDWVVASYNKNGGLEWLRDHKAFLVLSEKDGWRHAFISSIEKKDQKLLTPGDFDVIDRVKVDEAGGWFYYNASPKNGTQKYLYRVRLDGKGKSERVTPISQPGTHDYKFSQNGQWAFHTYSNGNTPPVTELVSFPEHRVVRVLEDNSTLREKMEKAAVQPKEFFKVDIGNAVVMDGWIIKPKDFDSSLKYPVFIYVYGEPHGQTVIDAWNHSYTDFHRAIADLGYIVISMDNRGTPCPKGAAWRRAVSGSLGPLSTEEQAAGISELGRKHSYVDLSRVGIWGWSGGGSNTLNAMFRKPEIYKVGIAVAPKPQPWLYNAWFQEIYMKTREVNPEGYRLSAPINFAEGLEGDLLILHGTGETNTHLQITEGLVDRLIELGKPFDYMAYPNRDHSLREGKGTVLHVRTLIVRYLLQHLPAGPG